MTIGSPEDLDGMVRVGKVVRLALDAMKKETRAGATTQQIDDVCARVLKEHGARSAPQLAYDFPGVSCISINDEAVHGIPRSTRAVRSGDLVKLDVAAELDGYVADAAETIAVGNASPASLKLARCAESALRIAIKAARAGEPINVIGGAVQSEVERQGFNVMPRLGGHGVGGTIHEEPSVHNYYIPWDNKPLSQGLVIAIEPVISEGSGKSVDAGDGWTVRTADGSS